MSKPDSSVFIDVEEPEFSRKQLEEFERKYGIPSHVFYVLHQLGMPQVDGAIAEQWAFEYERLSGRFGRRKKGKMKSRRQRLPTKEELEALRKKREEVARQLRALGITREQLEREALEIVRAIRERRDPEGGR